MRALAQIGVILLIVVMLVPLVMVMGKKLSRTYGEMVDDLSDETPDSDDPETS